MKSLDKVFTEQDVVDVSNKILVKTITKIKDELNNSFYAEMESYLFEHYCNTKDKILDNLISELADEFVKDPLNYKYTSIRRKLFEENKDVLTAALTKDLAEKGIDDVVWGNISTINHFNWRWAEYIARFIKDNIFELTENAVVNDKLLAQIRSQQQTINYLDQRVTEFTNKYYNEE